MIRTLRALPTIMRVGFVESLAYRAEMIIWVFATTMPFVMLALWTAVAEHAPVTSSSGRSWGSTQFVAYFLTMFVVRQMVSSWAAWEINWEIRQGTLAMRLLRPMHPVLAYGTSNLAALPLRALVSVPVAIVLAFTSADQLTHDWRVWLVWAVSMASGWAITFFANVLIGSLALFMESSSKVMDVWLTSFFIFSGYLFPLDLFPPWLVAASKWLPFRFQVGLPVELLTGQHTFETALPLLGQQFLWVIAMVTVSLSLWKVGVRRFQAFGG